MKQILDALMMIVDYISELWNALAEGIAMITASVPTLLSISSNFPTLLSLCISVTLSICVVRFLLLR